MAKKKDKKAINKELKKLLKKKKVKINVFVLGSTGKIPKGIPEISNKNKELNIEDASLGK